MLFFTFFPFKSHLCSDAGLTALGAGEITGLNGGSAVSVVPSNGRCSSWVCVYVSKFSWPRRIDTSSQHFIFPDQALNVCYINITVVNCIAAALTSYSITLEFNETVTMRLKCWLSDMNGWFSLLWWQLISNLYLFIYFLPLLSSQILPIPLRLQSNSLYCLGTNWMREISQTREEREMMPYCSTSVNAARFSEHCGHPLWIPLHIFLWLLDDWCFASRSRKSVQEKDYPPALHPWHTFIVLDKPFVGGLQQKRLWVHCKWTLL